MWALIRNCSGLRGMGSWSRVPKPAEAKPGVPPSMNFAGPTGGAACLCVGRQSYSRETQWCSHSLGYSLWASCGSNLHEPRGSVLRVSLHSPRTTWLGKLGQKKVLQLHSWGKRLLSAVPLQACCCWWNWNIWTRAKGADVLISGRIPNEQGFALTAQVARSIDCSAHTCLVCFGQDCLNGWFTDLNLVITLQSSHAQPKVKSMLRGTSHKWSLISTIWKSPMLPDFSSFPLEF